MEYLQKDMGANIMPRYMTPWSQDSSFATAAESKIPFELRLSVLQEFLLAELNQIITESLCSSYPTICKSETLSLVADKPVLETRSEKFMTVQQLYNMRAATFNELRESAGLSTVEGGDRWGEEPPLDKMTIQQQIVEKAHPKKLLRETLKKAKLTENVLRPTNRFAEYVKIASSVDKKDRVFLEVGKENTEILKEQFQEAVKDFMKSWK